MFQLLRSFIWSGEPAAPHATKTVVSISARAMIQEWRNSTFNNTGNKYTADRRIESLEKQFLQEHPHHSYDLDKFRQYDSIFKLATEEDVSNGTAENRACQDGLSQLHYLRCGHFVFSDHISACGPNCVEPQADVAHFFCLLCTRYSIQRAPLKASDRWQDLLVPTLNSPNKEAAVWSQNHALMRKVEAAYIDDEQGYIILPRVHYTIAMVRALDTRKEAAVKAALMSACATGLGKHKDIGPIATVYLDHFLVFRKCFKEVDMRILAVVAIWLALKDKGTPANRDVLVERMNAPLHRELDTFCHTAEDNIIDWGAILTFEGILRKMPAELRAPTISIAVRQVVQRIWSKLSESPIMSRTQRWHDRARTLAFCIKLALTYCHKDIEYGKILEFAGEKPNGFMDNLIINKLKKFTAATDWSKDVSQGRSGRRRRLCWLHGRMRCSIGCSSMRGQDRSQYGF